MGRCVFEGGLCDPRASQAGDKKRRNPEQLESAPYHDIWSLSALHVADKDASAGSDRCGYREFNEEGSDEEITDDGSGAHPAVDVEVKEEAMESHPTVNGEAMEVNGEAMEAVDVEVNGEAMEVKEEAMI